MQPQDFHCLINEVGKKLTLRKRTSGSYSDGKIVSESSTDYEAFGWIEKYHDKNRVEGPQEMGMKKAVFRMIGAVIPDVNDEIVYDGIVRHIIDVNQQEWGGNVLNYTCLLRE